MPVLPDLTLSGHQVEALVLGTLAVFVGILILYWEMQSPVYRSGCQECQIAREKEKGAGPNKSSQRNPPGAGNGGGWAV